MDESAKGAVLNILLHICCAPCTIYPLKVLREQGVTVSGYFFNPNIHPYREYLKRLETLKDYAARVDLKVSFADDYPLEEFLVNTSSLGSERCLFCYEMRLNCAASWARQKGFDSFTTTLLYSRFQKHNLIKEIGERIAKTRGIPFLYCDFREGWKEGIERSKELGLYRQPYCGCIYSEKERFMK